MSNYNSKIKIIVSSTGVSVMLNEDTSVKNKNSTTYWTTKKDSEGRIREKYVAIESYNVIVYQAEFKYDLIGKTIFKREEYYMPYTDGSRKLHNDNGPAFILEVGDKKTLEWWNEGVKVVEFGAKEGSWSLDIVK